MAASEQERWSQHVTETSDALSLEPEVFKLDDPVRIARSLSESAEESDAPQSRTISLCDVDADLLHQSRRQKSS